MNERMNHLMLDETCCLLNDCLFVWLVFFSKPSDDGQKRARFRTYSHCTRKKKYERERERKEKLNIVCLLTISIFIVDLKFLKNAYV